MDASKEKRYDSIYIDNPTDLDFKIAAAISDWAGLPQLKWSLNDCNPVRLKVSKAWTALSVKFG